MNKLTTNIGNITIQNPVICTSGCFGHAYEAAPYTDLSKIGAVSLKTVTIEPRRGNLPPRIHEVPSGVMSSIGLQNPGFDCYVKDIMPKVQSVLRSDQIFLSIAGSEKEEYVRLAKRVQEVYSKKDIAALEINAACPNVKSGGGAISKDPTVFFDILNSIVKDCEFPVVVKMGVDFDAYCESAKAAEMAGVQAIYTSATPIAMAIDIRTGLVATGNLKAPISGPAIKPIGIAKTWDLYNSVKIPIIASGGVSCAEDVIEYMMAGATAVGIGSASFVNPDVAATVVTDLEKYVIEKKYANISEIIGLAHALRK